MQVQESGRIRPVWTITRFANDEDFRAGKSSEVRDGKTGELLPAVSRFAPNLLLNEGITRLLNLLIGGGGTAYNNASARLGVGDSATGEDAAQTGLVAAVNKTYKAMEATYPQISGQGVTFRSVFGSGDANYDWNEFSVDNGAGADENLNRKVSAQGTKASGQTWTLDLTVTFS